MDEMWVFHGSAQRNILPIMTGGFKIGGQDIGVANGSVYGQGVYTAIGPNTPMQYAGGNQVVLALALPGAEGAQGVGDSWRPHQDWCIFKTKVQVLPRYVLHFR